MYYRNVLTLGFLGTASGNSFKFFNRIALFSTNYGLPNGGVLKGIGKSRPEHSLQLFLDPLGFRSPLSILGKSTQRSPGTSTRPNRV